MLKIYGVPNSQPVRAVVWTCLMKRLPFEFVMTSQNKAAKTPEYLNAVNPRGTIPAIDDDGVVLWESHAILIYLCEKHGWSDLWPDDVLARARVNQYLHFHHRNTREIVVQWSRALWPAVFGVEDPDEAWFKRNIFPGMQNNQQIVEGALQIIDGMLAQQRWLAGPTVTLADISAYEELGQNQSKFANCTDYDAYPNICRWLADMELLPFHGEAHAIWRLIGDLQELMRINTDQPSEKQTGMRGIARANKEAAKILQSAAA